MVEDPDLDLGILKRIEEAGAPQRPDQLASALGHSVAETEAAITRMESQGRLAPSDAMANALIIKRSAR